MTPLPISLPPSPFLPLPPLPLPSPPLTPPSPLPLPSPPLCYPGDVAGGYPVFLLGNNFVNTSALGCRFADLLTRGIFVSNHTILCIAPSTIGQSSPPDPPHLHIFST